MYDLRMCVTILSLPAFWFAAIIAPLASGCDSGPPPAVAPETPAPVDKEQFADAKLTFKGENVKDNRLILEKGKEYEYSGSFRLTQVDDEAPEFKEYVERIRETLRLMFIVDGEESGFKRSSSARSQTKAVREVIVGKEFVESSRVDSSNVVHFEGRLNAPNKVGELELRLSILPRDAQESVYIITRPVEIVEPKTPNGT